MKKAVGFNKLVGVTIGKVEDSAINHVVMYSADGKTMFTISAEIGAVGVPIITLKAFPFKENVVGIPEKDMRPKVKKKAT